MWAGLRMWEDCRAKVRVGIAYYEITCRRFGSLHLLDFKLSLCFELNYRTLNFFLLKPVTWTE
jgi:hypothetical protein